MIVFIVAALAQDAPTGEPSEPPLAVPVGAVPEGLTAEQPEESGPKGTAVLVQDTSQSDLQGVEVRFVLRDGYPWVGVTNTGSGPLTLDWAASTMSPPNGPAEGLFALPSWGADPILSEVVEVGARVDRVAWPASWRADGPDNDAEQVLAWSSPNFSALSLSMARGDVVGVHQSEWRTQVEAPVAAPEPALAIRGGLVPAPTFDKEARQAWDVAFRGLRGQQRTANNVARLGLVVTTVSTLFLLGYIEEHANTPPNGPNDAGRTRREVSRSIGWSSGLAGAGLLTLVPAHVIHKRAKKGIQALGRRP